MINKKISKRRHIIQILITITILGFLVLAGTGSAVNDTPETVYYYQTGVSHLAGTWLDDSKANSIVIPDSSSFYIPPSVSEGIYYLNGDDSSDVLYIKSAGPSYSHISDNKIYSGSGETPSETTITITDSAGFNPTLVFAKDDDVDDLKTLDSYLTTVGSGVYKLSASSDIIGTWGVYADYSSCLVSKAPFEYRYAKIGVIDILKSKKGNVASILSISSDKVTDGDVFSISIKGPAYNTATGTGIVTVKYYEDGYTSSNSIEMTTTSKELMFMKNQENMISGSSFAIPNTESLTINVLTNTGNVGTTKYHLEVFVSGCENNNAGSVNNPLKTDIIVIGKSQITIIDVTNLNSPIAGNYPDTSAQVTGYTTNSTSGIILSNPVIEWYQSSTKHTSQFEIDKVYSVKITIPILSSSVEVSTDPTVKINGSTLPSSEVTKTTSSVIINHTFSKTGGLENSTTTSSTKSDTTGTLSIDSSPTGATIYIDGTYYGATPTTVSLDSGLHTIKLEKDGYSSITKTATITGGETTRLYPVLSKIYTSGTLAVSSIPSEATVYVDNVCKGTTPLTINLENGSHSVCVDKLGYEPYNTTVTISGGKTTVISPGLSELQSTGGKLLITSTPSGAVAYIDGKTYGVTPLVNTPLSTGSHQITLKLDGYEDWSKEFYITENNTTKVIVTLNKKSDLSGITLLSPPFLIAIIAILVCGIVVVIVTTKSSRRKRNSKNTAKPSEKTETTVNSVHTSETKQVTNTNIKNETKTEVKGGDTIINIHAENYVAGNVGTIAKDDAVVNRSGVDVFEQVRKCPYCGSDISADSDFCGKCGRRLR